SLERFARLAPELLVQQPARVLIGRERLRLPFRAVESEHELATKPLAKRMRLDQSLELGDELVVTPERQIGLDPLFDRRDPGLLEARDLGLSERVECEVCERGSAPERQSFEQRLRGLLRIPCA